MSESVGSRLGLALLACLATLSCRHLAAEEFCSDWDSLDHQALTQTLSLECSSLECGEVLNGAMAQRIADFRKSLATASLTTCERAAYDEWVWYHDYTLAEWCLPQCQRDRRVHASNRILPRIEVK